MGINQFRRNPVTGQWSVIIQNEYDINDLFSNEQTRKSKKTGDSEHCQFCGGFETETPSEIFSIRPNNTRKDDSGWSVRVIPDKKPFLQIYGDLNNRGIGMYDVLDGIGAHELVIETTEHNLQLYHFPLKQIEHVLAAYRERILDLKKDARFRYVLLHKNYGEGHKEVLFHSHTHIIATPITPTRVKTELMNSMEHYQYKERCLFCDIINQELSVNERVIQENEKFLALAPFASRSPFEVWIFPKAHETFFESNREHTQLATILKDILQKITTTLNHPNFVMVLHSGPNIANGRLRGYWKTLEKDYHWHIEITPRLRGFTSFDVGSGFHVNIVSPESATRILREGKTISAKQEN
ncbi:galactose-1-phosphate uridylyltransferase [candidate division KSB1 bacterium]|nr:galactose-1-phosphate uridylyltransferase [candidate division KSB1 bacterium]NIR70074.1 galactose-1-phosphate uridylyltransferase [candidate division KSB1 bacterium]NIS23324.1 galactose-1-phosphate uridylyltransferase [candidate division KSB1 bacterium]NIT70203.1 galactose-1-phosphate uridylyltransferase [candidate division KSB1 bacterium]NIU23855.1 galactose-1-phosphate uridylyltransferase [candidate division KSB1 bacterium]